MTIRMTFEVNDGSRLRIMEGPHRVHETHETDEPREISLSLAGNSVGTVETVGELEVFELEGLPEANAHQGADLSAVG